MEDRQLASALAVLAVGLLVLQVPAGGESAVGGPPRAQQHLHQRCALMLRRITLAASTHICFRNNAHGRVDGAARHRAQKRVDGCQTVSWSQEVPNGTLINVVVMGGLER